MFKNCLVILVLLFFCSVSAQTDQDSDLQISNVTKSYTNQIDPLAPATAAFYSAILPGLGQAYNKRYWMIPVIYGSMGASIYAYKWNDDKYNNVLQAYKLELAGKPHEFENLDVTALERAIKGYKKQKDLFLFITVGVYILNIVEANVDAHLPNNRIDTNLSYQPTIIMDPITNKVNFGASVTFKF